MKNLLFLFILVSLLISCKDDDPPTGSFSNELDNSYFPMTVGSYWVYEKYQITTGGDTIKQSSLNTISVEKDTLIDNILFSKFITKINGGNITQTDFYRFSLNEVYSNFGVKEFSATDFSDTLSHFNLIGFIESVYKMEKSPVVINTEIGELICLEKLGTHTPLNAAFTGGESHYYYSRGIGLVVYEDLYLSSGTKLQYQLIDYHIEPQ